MNCKNLRYSLLIVAVGLFTQLQAQSLASYERQMEQLFSQVENATSYAQNEQWNDSINTLFQVALRCDDSFNYPFESLKFVGKVLSDDKQIRLYTWNIPTDSNFIYNGYIQTADGTFYSLKQDTIDLPDEQCTYDNGHWYGALYYRIIAYKYNRQKHYILLGWHGATGLTQYKVIDVLTFDHFGNVQLGAPLFHDEDQCRKRCVFVYDAETSMFLDYEAPKHRLVFDHLFPIKYFDEDTFTLGPDMSIDAYVRKSKGWFMKGDIHAKNKRN